MKTTEKSSTASATRHAEAAVVYKKRSQFGSICKRFCRNKTAMAGLIIFLLILILSCCAGLFFNYETDALQITVSDRFISPGAEHWFGTDNYGRDIFARIVFGGRISLLISLVVILISSVLGAIFGSLAAYYGGWVDNLIMRVNDVFFAIPFTLLAVCIVASLGNGVQNVCLACTVAVLPGFIRLFRSNVMPIMNQEYVEAARSYGTKDARILYRHILPNALGPIIVQATLNLAGTIIAVAGLSFIGLGVQSPTPEWGSMLNEAREYMRDHVYMILIPGLTIMISSLSLNLVGDGLRDALDPKLKN